MRKTGRIESANGVARNCAGGSGRDRRHRSRMRGARDAKYTADRDRWTTARWPGAWRASCADKGVASRWLQCNAVRREHARTVLVHEASRYRAAGIVWPGLWSDWLADVGRGKSHDSGFIPFRGGLPAVADGKPR